MGGRCQLYSRLCRTRHVGRMDMSPGDGMAHFLLVTEPGMRGLASQTDATWRVHVPEGIEARYGGEILECETAEDIWRDTSPDSKANQRDKGGT